MKISARNVFEGKITAIKEGPINAEVELTTAGGDKIVAIVTDAGVRSLGLAIGKTAAAVAKAPSIILLAPDSGYVFSTRNQIKGTVSKIAKGAVNSQVAVMTPGGATISAVVTNDAVDELGLRVGATTIAVFKASQVLLAVPI